MKEMVVVRNRAYHLLLIFASSLVSDFGGPVITIDAVPEGLFESLGRRLSGGINEALSKPQNSPHLHHHHHSDSSNGNEEDSADRPATENAPTSAEGVSGEERGRLGMKVENLLHSVGVNSKISHRLGQIADAAARNFLAPQPGTIPPHVQRRIIRYCAEHLSDEQCRKHPEWTPKGKLPSSGTSSSTAAGENNTLLLRFPKWIPFELAPIRIDKERASKSLSAILKGVPTELKSLVPKELIAELGDVARSALEATCAALRAGSCKKQRVESLNKRATIAEQEAALHQALGKGGAAAEMVDHAVETRLARTHQVKQALLDAVGLGGKVAAANDGTFQQDILLTEEQSMTMLADFQQQHQQGDNTSEGGRVKRNSIFFDQGDGMANKWPVGQPIPYWLDASLAPADRRAVEEAIREIQQKSCVRFTQARQLPQQRPGVHYLHYVKADNPTFYIGRVSPVNTIYLSFQCGNPVGIAVHETLHALGLNHVQLRADRDEFIRIRWENVDPQNFDFFAVANMTLYTSYGIPYDYGSIMHYGATIASQQEGKKTMVARMGNKKSNTQLMGQRRGMSASDVEMLRRMYCAGPSCVDRNVYCGSWALLKLCATEQWTRWMASNCAKSCGKC